MISKVMRDWPMMYVQNSSNLVAFFMFQFPFFQLSLANDSIKQ